MPDSFPSIEQASNCEYWRELCPDLSIQGPGKTPVVTLPDLSVLTDCLRVEGYVNHPGVVPDDSLARLQRAFLNMEAKGIPPVFGFVYDEFWTLFRALSPFLAKVLGNDYRVLPAFWAWFVKPSDDAAGWRPHRDRTHGGLAADGSPLSLTIWMPVTDATTLNGCMYVLPHHLDAGLKTLGKNGEATNTTFGLPDIRALPATAGSLLGWHQMLYHWGSRASRLGTAPRCSIAVEFQRGDIPPFEKHLIRPDAMLSFESRLGLIGQLARRYTGFQNQPPAVQSLAQVLEGKYFSQFAAEVGN